MKNFLTHLLILITASLGCIDAAAQNNRKHFEFDATKPMVHDPVVAYCDGRYYIFATGRNLASMSSADLKTWQMELPVMPEIPQWAKDSVPGYRGHTWAPDIHFHNGTWYLYYSCSTFGRNTSAIGLMTNKTINPSSPDYKWQDQGMVIKSSPGKTNWNAIDPNLIFDENGKPWLTWGSFWDGIQIIPLADDLKTPIGTPKTIARRYAKNSVVRDSVAESLAAQAPHAGQNAIEAPFIIRHGEYFYLFVSWDYCCKGEDSNYKTVLGRSLSVTGPFLDRSGKDMASGGGSIIAQPDQDYYGIGHNSAYNFHGQWYFFAHGYDKSHNGESRLVTRKMHFDEDGWPVLE